MEVRKPKAIIFDMDGCLIDSEVVYMVAWEVLFKKYNIPITNEHIHTWRGKGWGKIREEILELLPYADQVDNLYIERDEWFYDRLYDGKVQYKPGALEFLDYLDAQGIPYGIATSTYRKKATKILDHMNILNRANFVIFGDDVTETKPSPEIYIKAANKFSCDKDDILLFEDSLSGILSAVAAKLKVVQILSDFDDPNVPEVLKEITSFTEMIELWQE